MIVLDASLTGAFFFEDEANPQVDQIMRRCAETGATAPSIWPVEIANIFRAAVRRKRITFEQRSAYFERLRTIGVQVDVVGADLAWGELTSLADLHDLTIYDAAYLELALRRQLPLATLDKDLAAAAQRECVEVLP